jgi:hypothetical protein
MSGAVNAVVHKLRLNVRQVPFTLRNSAGTYLVQFFKLKYSFNKFNTITVSIHIRCVTASEIVEIEDEKKKRM